MSAHRTLVAFFMAVLFTGGPGGCSDQSSTQNPSIAAGGVAGPTQTTAMTPLNAAEQQALRDALDDEYRAWTTYDQVIHDLGEMQPFVNIRDAEARHIAELRTLFEQYELQVPANPWLGKVPRYANRREACQAGIDAEIENAALYDRLMRSTNRPDILAVFERLQSASQERHLQAFRRCVTSPGRGWGARGTPR